MRSFCLLLVCLFALSHTPVLMGADDEKKSEEEKLRDEAAKLLTGGDKRESIHGRLAMTPEQQDDKPYPKVVGLLSDKGVTYQIMILEPDLRKRLLTHDKTEITLLGRILSKGDQGMFFITDEVYQANALGPKQKKKRGGL